MGHVTRIVAKGENIKHQKNTLKIKKIGHKSELRPEDREYRYNPDITNQLDSLEGDFDENVINKIVLWKVNRYPRLHPDLIVRLNRVKGDKEHKPELRNLLIDLLGCTGVQLPMASTFLRFRNPKLFQIIDQRVYRLLTGHELSLPLLNSQRNKEKVCEIYLEYLELLKNICKELEIPFEKADRILYNADKRINKDVKLKNYGA